MTLRLIFVGLIFFVKCSQEVCAQESFQLSTMSGAMFSHSTVTDNLNFRKSLGIQSTVLWKLPPSNSSVPSKPALNYRYLGFSVQGMDMGDGFLNGSSAVRKNLARMGYGIGAMIVTGGNLHFKDHFEKNDIRIQFGFGPMIVSKFYHSVNNPNNLAISSLLNFESQLKGQFLHRLNKNFSIAVGGELFHVSNSNINKPNIGYNYIQANIGLKYDFYKAFHPSNNFVKKYNDRTYVVNQFSTQYSAPFQLSFRLAYRKFRKDFPFNYSIWIFEGDYGISSKKINKMTGTNYLTKDEWRFGINLFHEMGSTKIMANGASLQLDPRWEFGIYGRRVIKMGPLDLLIDLGTYIIPPQADRLKLLQKNKYLYNAFGAQYHVSKQLFIIHRIKAHYNIADYMELGLVARL